MKSRGIIDIYLPQKVAYHLKIVLSSILIAIFFNLIWSGQVFNENFWIMLVLLIIQLEIFMALAFRIFDSDKIQIGETYQKKIIIKLLKFYLLVLLIAMGFTFMTIMLSMILGDQSFAEVVDHFFHNELKGMLVSWLIGISIGSLIFFYMEWNNALKREQKLREEKLIFQYETLKNQVNPHFLFNSLNTLSSLVSTDAQLSEKFIAKFSSIYRYILENRDKDLVPLNDELEFVEDFFFLQKIRDDGKIELDIKIDNPDRYNILPISLQMLIENALKHNAATREEPLKIMVSRLDDYLIIENKMTPKMRLEPSSKIGLKNLQERAKLAMNREVIIHQSQELFTVKMPIKSI